MTTTTPMLDQKTADNMAGAMLGRHPLIAALLGDDALPLVSGMLEPGMPYWRVNLKREAIAAALDDMEEADGAMGIPLPQSTVGAHFVWRRVATDRHTLPGRMVPTRPVSEEGRELNNLSLDAMDLALGWMDSRVLVQAGGLFFEPPVREWMDNPDIGPDLLVAMAGYVGAMFTSQHRPLSRKGIGDLESLGFPVPSDELSCPRTEQAIMTAARAAIVRAEKEKR